MITNLSGKFIRGLLYGLAGNALAMLTFALAHYTPAGNTVTLYLWNGLVVGAFTGLVAALKRRITWDPTAS